MENYFDELRERAKDAKTIGTLNEINKIGRRTLDSIISDSRIKNSIKKSSRKKYRLLRREIQRRKKKLAS